MPRDRLFQGGAETGVASHLRRLQRLANKKRCRHFFGRRKVTIFALAGRKACSRQVLDRELPVHATANRISADFKAHLAQAYFGLSRCETFTR